MKTISIIVFTVLLSAHAFGQSMITHSDEKYGFRLTHPSDWTVKEAMTEATVFKAVKKFEDGQFLMFTVNAQLLDRNDYSMTDFTIQDITGFARKMYGADNVKVLDSSHGQVGQESSIKLLLEARPPNIQPGSSTQPMSSGNDIFTPSRCPVTSKYTNSTPNR
ncbi:MAG: hypothetical protein IT393_04330 [Nitrospirae bacterium]|nr:hypothetical protein [Nitrospirota bacterium]